MKGVNTVGMTRQGLDAADAESLAEHYRAEGSLSDWTPPEALHCPALAWWSARTSAA